MKRINNLFLVLSFMLLIGISFNVKADSFEYYITNSNNYEPINNNDKKNINRGDTITVTAMIFNGEDSVGYRISSGKLTIRWDEKFVSLQEVNGKYYNESVSSISGLTIASVNKTSNKLTISEIRSTGTLQSKLNKLVEFKFKVLENATSGDTKIYQMDGEDTLRCLTSENQETSCGESSLSELKYTIAKSTINKLSSLKIDGHTLEYFNENTNDYDITVENDVEKINIEVVKKDSLSTVTGDVGEKKVDYGNNKFTITVTSESGLKNTYTLNVVRDDARSNVNTLKKLTISSGTLTFKPNVLEYTVNVLNEVDKVTITSELTDSKAKYVEDYRNKEINLVEGSNKVEIKVVSEKGEEKVYVLNINRALSSNNSLKTLKVNDEKIKLLENEFIYNLEVENDVDKVVITAVPNDEKATVKLDDEYPLEVGENEINIKVVAASGQEASYILNITRKKILSKDSYLTSLKIKGYQIDFKPTVTLYNLKIDEKDTELEITTTQEDPNAVVEIEGNKDLENGSIIKVNVKAEDGSFTRYFINIEKGSSGISPIIIIIIVLLLILGGCIGYIIYRKKKNENAEFNKLDDDNEVKETIPEPPLEEIPETIPKVVPQEVENNVSDNDNYVGAHVEDYVGVHEEERTQTKLEDIEKDV